MPRKKIPVIYTDKNGNEKRYESIMMASICTGIQSYTIRKNADTKKDGWRFADSFTETKKEYKHRRKIVKADPITGEKIEEYVSLQHAADLNNTLIHNISDSCKFKDRLFKGYVYLYKDEYSIYEAKYVFIKSKTSFKERKEKRLDKYKK